LSNKKTDQRITLKDIAKAANVNVSTVSRALDPNPKHKVSSELAERIRKTSSRLGYRPNAAAYSLKTNKTRAIGVIIPDITDPIFPPIIRGIEDGLSRHHYISIVANTDNDVAREADVLESLSARGVDGLILATTKRRDSIASQLAGDRPVVTIIRAMDHIPCSSVTHDEDEGIRRILGHLASLGHRDVATIAGPQDVSTGFMRYNSFVRYCRTFEINEDGTQVSFARTFSEDEGERCTEELLLKGRRFTALVCANDQLAIGAIAALQRRGLRCPRDVSVTGFNDMPLAGRLQPPLTTIRAQHHKLGLEAAQLILAALLDPEAGHQSHHIVLPVELVVRDSTAVAHQVDSAS
jgi:LacI family transcriptional regulator